MKSTAKKQTVYYHVTQFGDAANIMKTGQMRGGMISSDERKAHLRAGVSTRGYYISLARSLSSHYVAHNMRRSESFCVLMIDTDKIHGRFRLAPVNYANFKREYSEYEERLISDTELIDVSNAVVGIVLLARMESKKYIVRIPRKFFPFCKGRELFYVTLKNIAAKRPLNLKIAAGYTTLTETRRYVAPSKISHRMFGVLTTPLDNVPELPPSDLVNYARMCVNMLFDTDSQVYQTKQVYDYVASLAVRKKVQPEVVIRSMLDVSRAALEKRADSIFKEYVVDFAGAVKKARRLQHADEAFSGKAFELGAFAQVFQQFGLVKQSGIFEGLHEVYSRLRRVAKRNSPREMAKLSRSTSKLELERGLLSDFHDDHEFDLESLKDFVFAESPNLRERLAPYIDELYRN